MSTDLLRDLLGILAVERPRGLGAMAEELEKFVNDYVSERVTVRSEVRDDVYGAIDGERDYQDKRWTANNTPSKGRHETAAFLTYMREYLRRAELLASSFADDGVAPPSHEFMGESALDFVRKITALGVACMEQNGAPRRAEPGCEHVSGPTRCSNCAYES